MSKALLNNIILNADAYKASHFKQYPPGTTYVSSYIESRGGQYEDVMSFGLQAFIKQYLLKPITMEDIDNAEMVLKDMMGLPFNREGWEHIVNAHQGFLPVAIETVPEGTIIPAHNVTVQIVNTDPKCFWLTSYLETALLRGVWYPNTVATRSYECKKIIQAHMEQTCDDLQGLPFKLNDFGARGASSTESSGIGGMSHLVNFAGSDTVMGVVNAFAFYGYKGEMQGVPAAEHSTITAWGEKNEKEAYLNMLRQYSGEGKIVAVVSDSYNLYNAVENLWGGELRDEVINNGGLVVIRPDSGEPVDVVCKTLEILAEKFGTVTNTKGYKLLPPYIRVIQGDGINATSIDAILTEMKERGFSADNVVFGMGGELLQRLDRDTQRYAQKTSAVRIEESSVIAPSFPSDIDLPQRGWSDCEIHHPVYDRAIKGWRAVAKRPQTDLAKASKKGILALTFDEKSGYVTCRREQLGERKNLLQTVYVNGKLLKEVTFYDVRSTAQESACKLNDYRARVASCVEA